MPSFILCQLPQETSLINDPVISAVYRYIWAVGECGSLHKPLLWPFPQHHPAYKGSLWLGRLSVRTSNPRLLLSVCGPWRSGPDPQLWCIMIQKYNNKVVETTIYWALTTCQVPNWELTRITSSDWPALRWVLLSHVTDKEKETQRG